MRSFSRNKKGLGLIILVASLLFAVIFMNTVMVFRQTRQQIWNAGIYQLEIISKEVEDMISKDERLTMELAISAGQYLDDREALKDYLYEERDLLVEGDTGAFNAYIAGSDWAIIPGYDIPEDYIITERIWYRGAIKNGGKVYVSSPYQDAMTGDICYTVSIMLPDQDTVFAVDYVMDDIQAHLMQTEKLNVHDAVIVTGDGVIAGYSDESYIGKNLKEALPDYLGIWALSKNTDGVSASKLKSDFLYEYLFATKSAGGWYLIVSESDWELYKESYIQLLLTILLAIALFSTFVMMYLVAIRNQKSAESALASKEAFLDNITSELRDPLTRIISTSDQENITDYGAEMSRIHESGMELARMIDQIISYKSMVRTTEDGSEKKDSYEITGMNRRFRALIIALILLIMVITLYVNVNVTTNWGNELMQSVAQNYENELTEWITRQKGILDMFVSIISTHPEILEDYDETIKYLNDITMQYPEISVTYIGNPRFDPDVYMNNGWKPEPGWHVGDRPWYMATIASDDGWSISAPYYDDQTGGYCVTFSEAVYDSKTGEFLGIFGIDFFMDKLVEILGDSYSMDGYAFLVDPDGDIINHPYGSYQMSENNKINVSHLPYGNIENSGKDGSIIKDYDGSYRILRAAYNPETRFTVYVVHDIWSIYGKVFVYALICAAASLLCIILIYRVLSNLMRWQDETNRRMKDAADAALAAGRAKSQFLAQMSHEIRTPINAILGMNEMILRESKDGDILDYAGDISSAGKTLLAIINSILDFSKIEDGKMEIIPVRYETAELIHSLESSVHERARAKLLDLSVVVDESIPSALYGDDVRISQVISNLLTNAVKYTDEGEIVLTIKDLGREGGNVRLFVSVSDTGIGIKEEDKERLFESFERLDKKRNRSIEGTGLGMSIVTRLLAMMDSSLNVESTYGKGSVFSFELKQKIADETPMGAYSRINFKGSVSDKRESAFLAPEARVLVVDDNRMNLKVAKSLLKLNGIVPDLAESGFEAMEMAGVKRYDIILLDHMMPKLDGIETLQKMREEKIIPRETVVVALTANAVVGSREKYLRAGFDDYLAKPIDVSQLESVLKEYLSEDLIKTDGADKDAGKNTDKDSGDPGIRLEIDDDDDDDDVILVPESGYRLEKLKDAGVDTKEGLEYCADDEEIYFEVLQEYAADSKEKDQLLVKYYDDKNWADYRIIIHSLKSASRTIGADEVSDLAKALEDAAAGEEVSFIDENHEIFRQKYSALTGVIKGLF